MSAKQDPDRTPAEWARIQSMMAPPSSRVIIDGPSARECERRPFLAGLSGADPGRVATAAYFAVGREYDWAGGC